MRQPGSQLGLEDDERRERAVGEHELEEVRDHGELHDPRDRVHEHEHDDADEHLHRPGALDEQQHAVEHEGDDHDLDEIARTRMQQAELIENGIHGRREPGTGNRELGDCESPGVCTARPALMTPHATSSA